MQNNIKGFIPLTVKSNGALIMVNILAITDYSEQFDGNTAICLISQKSYFVVKDNVQEINQLIYDNNLI